MSSPLQSRLASGLRDKRSPSPLSPTTSAISSPSPVLSTSPTPNSILSAMNGLRQPSLAPLDLTPHLQRSVHSVVKSRTGSVLSRGFILKTDYYPSGSRILSGVKCSHNPNNLLNAGRALDLDLTVHGAPNFRAPKQDNLNVFGTAQPRTQGLRAILSILRCNPGVSSHNSCVWFSTREEPIGSSTFAVHAYSKIDTILRI